MKEIIFEEMVAGLKKPGQDILDSLTPEKCDAWHMASCVPGEAGELFDAVKKHVIYNKPIDRANVVEELGDLEFYMEGLRQNLSITRQETIDGNIEKLGKRYSEGKYSDAAAGLRADKVQTYYVLQNSGDAIFVKEGEFFKSQGGLTQDWGKPWHEISATSLRNANDLAREFFADKNEDDHTERGKN